MGHALTIIRIFFITMCVFGSWLIWYSIPEWESDLWMCLTIGGSIGALTILLDMQLKGFSLRGLSALTFGLAIGSLIAFLLGTSPLFKIAEQHTLYLARLVLFVVCMYLGAVIALRGRDEFNLVIPYVRFVPHEVDVPLVVVDTSVLIDGRIRPICASRFLTAALIIPRFVIDELQRVADSSDPVRQAKGRKGLMILNELKSMPHMDLRIEESALDKREQVDSKLVFVAKTMKAKLMTLDYNLSQLALFQGVECLNINDLAKTLNPEVVVGEQISIELVKQGKEGGQAVGYLSDGSMVVVNEAAKLIGKTVPVEVVSVLPSAGGKMIFAKLLD